MPARALYMPEDRANQHVMLTATWWSTLSRMMHVHTASTKDGCLATVWVAFACSHHIATKEYRLLLAGCRPERLHPERTAGKL